MDFAIGRNRIYPVPLASQFNSPKMFAGTLVTRRNFIEKLSSIIRKDYVRYGGPNSCRIFEGLLAEPLLAGPNAYGATYV